MGQEHKATSHACAHTHLTCTPTYAGGGVSPTAKGTEMPPLNTLDSRAVKPGKESLERVREPGWGWGAPQALPCEDVQGWGEQLGHLGRALTPAL